MGLFSFLRKNKQQTDPDQGAYRSKADTGFNSGSEQGELPLRARKAKASKAANQSNEAVDPVLPEKKRARRRLVGAVALVLAVVIVLPMILDSEPKPLADDIAIQIPSRDKSGNNASNSADASASASAKAAASVSNSSGLDRQEEIVDPAGNTPVAPTPAPPAAVTSKPAVSGNTAVTAAPTPPLAAVAPPEAAPKSEAKPESKPKPEAKPKPEQKPKPKAEPNPVADKHDDAARALAILDGRTDTAPAADKKPAKFVLQVAALASQDKVNELQGKLKEAGIHSYTQKVPTQAGDRIRIRVGPFSSKEEAERTRAKLSKLGLSGSLIPG
ncbi:SPOR domain-containing protein [Collimonas sp.]|uniref:SPOR domain-containing protein n=1 Tax=Collimonas sp. TaxID=1963772 RepID=UPI002BBFDAB0|nr:SPOR domain-containing protein [Collimonas sp.]HWW04390.1 SPOR domain-containing protein [Collimonas sp.]